MDNMKTNLSNEEKKNKISQFLNLYYSNSNSFKINQLPSWISLFASILQKEVNNDLPKYYRQFAPGEVVLVNFGVSIGQELCGTHFAIVLNKKDNKYNSTLLVVPLSSKYHDDYVSLDRELAERMEETVKKSNKEINRKLDHIQKEGMEYFKLLINFHDSNIKANAEEISFLKSMSLLPASKEDYKNNTEIAQKNVKISRKEMSKIKGDKKYPLLNKYMTIYEISSNLIKKSKKINTQILKVSHFREETKKHNNRSYAAINNIKTISKLRLINFYDRGLVDRILVSEDSLNKIKTSLYNLI